MKYVIAAVTAGGLAFFACGGSRYGDGDCDTEAAAYETCVTGGGVNVRNICEADIVAGYCDRSLFWACYTDHECSSTNDTDAIAALEACLAANEACE